MISFNSTEMKAQVSLSNRMLSVVHLSICRPSVNQETLSVNFNQNCKKASIAEEDSSFFKMKRKIFFKGYDNNEYCKNTLTPFSNILLQKNWASFNPTKHKAIVVANEGLCFFPRGDYNEIERKKLTKFKQFSSPKYLEKVIKQSTKYSFGTGESSLFKEPHLYFLKGEIQ